ncbi:MAG: D-arabinono-1,4-lactone oxidase [Nocardioidaceae bacterium]
MSPTHCTQQRGVPGPWHERLPHFRLNFTPSSGEELQSEYLLPRQAAADAISALYSLGEDIARVLQISEIRTVARDDLWMSPSYQRDCVALHFTWIANSRAVAPVVEAIESQLEPFGAKPHWGKVFSTKPQQVAALYERSSDFQQLLVRFDPTGKFRNDFVDTYLSGQ